MNSLVTFSAAAFGTCCSSKPMNWSSDIASSMGVGGGAGAW
ncbi:MAG: hypothetical protein NTX64_16470 [Elusimicrobia bacterium]|nr:hypothetical protein [Elusimicrobiota bacterium]